MSEHLHLPARKRRQRRISNDSPGNSCCLTIPPIFDRLEYLQQQIHTINQHKHLDSVLVTDDRYLSLALTQHLFKYQHTRICVMPDEVTPLLEQTPPPRVIIDLDSIHAPIIDVLDITRQWKKKWPELSLTLLTANRHPEVSCFIAAAATCQVIERRLEIATLAELLTQKPCSTDAILPNQGTENYTFPAKEWNILLKLAKGDSLKSIALASKKPYHSIVYVLGRITALIGLDTRKSLIYLLHELSIAATERN